jgi:hypothetical protein
MLVLCQNCTELPFPPCHQQWRIMTERMRRFLGAEGYERFLASAPLRGRAPSPADGLSSPKS